MASAMIGVRGLRSLEVVAVEKDDRALVNPLFSRDGGRHEGERKDAGHTPKTPQFIYCKLMNVYS